MNMKVFFDEVRTSLFWGRLRQSQVNAILKIFKNWETHGDGDNRKLAYILASVYHETGSRMAPVRETFAKSDREARENLKELVRKRGQDSAVARYSLPTGPYGLIYYGRGGIQTTWIYNYRKWNDVLNMDFVKNPNLMLDPDISARVAVQGMMEGLFSGVALDRYFNSTIDDPVNARRVVNGTDRQNTIAEYHYKFLEAIEESVNSYEDESTQVYSNTQVDKTMEGGVGITGLGGSLAVLGELFSTHSEGLKILSIIIIVVGIILYVNGRRRFYKEYEE